MKFCGDCEYYRVDHFRIGNDFCPHMGRGVLTLTWACQAFQEKTNGLKIRGLEHFNKNCVCDNCHLLKEFEAVNGSIVGMCLWDYISIYVFNETYIERGKTDCDHCRPIEGNIVNDIML
jgi:hypothetical protein